MSSRTLKDDIKTKMQELGILPKRSLGQNFLISDSVVAQIFATVARIKPQYVVEVGPGLGSLTEKLIQAKIPHELIELDFKFAHMWQTRGEKVHQGDALQMDWEELNLPKNTLFLSNLPYQISSRIMIERCLGPRSVEFMILMFQKEVAQRMVAEPTEPDYGFLSIVAQTFWRIEKVCEVGPTCFLPPPNVASRVLSFRRQSDVRPDILLNQKFVQFVKTAFQFRRKMLVKNLSLPKEVLFPALEELGYNEKVRGEEISVTDFQKLFEKVQGR